jgi:hypothetical protein
MLGPLQGNKSWKLKHYFDNANTTYKDVKSVTSWGVRSQKYPIMCTGHPIKFYASNSTTMQNK